ncbi:helix-turn-helix transcriptional regulator [Pseudofrankia saprophytica]|uniref:helix-turn-helix transcriptional regulator n=1 Tax=Pseudofrankia saprophytica TaxID=298655 RepID=UPI000234B0F0|nr:helix-turn-helix transcriptional regulator [Pseudofrankia saprophytica]
MDNREQVRSFLASRRARITPEQVGLPTYGGLRRVPGLRRDEVAQLAGVSVDYYTRLERGDLTGASDSVLSALARALRLADDERQHLFALARVARAGRGTPKRRPRQVKIRESIRAIVEGLSDLPACVVNGRMDLVMTNRMGRTLYDPLFDDPTHPPNHARFVFLDTRAHDFWVDWEVQATEVVGALRAAAGRDPYDKDLTDLIGELVTRNDRFRTWWGSHDVFNHRGGTKKINHPVVGRLDLTYEILTLPSDPDLSILTYSAPPQSPSHDGLQLLAAWTATGDETTPGDRAIAAEMKDSPQGS